MARGQRPGQPIRDRTGESYGGLRYRDERQPFRTPLLQDRPRRSPKPSGRA